MSRSGSEQSPPDDGRYETPLVIVSQQGRNSEASRRIVRAQAARASAAQSRVTRARNREEREWTQREGGQSVSSGETSQQAPNPSARSSHSDQGSGLGQLPLSVWLGNIVILSPSAATDRAATLGEKVRPTETGVTDGSAATDVFGRLQRSTSSEGTRSGGSPGIKLPLATPKGFAALQQRVAVSSALLNLLSRTACVDFASPGVEHRLHELLVDLIVFTAGSTMASQPSHPVQGHLRLACSCLTIFQGQRANGAVFAHDQRYQNGLAAAWSEAVLLDLTALAEPKAAEASLWAVFMISVTTGSSTNFFHSTLHGLFQDLQLRYWEQVRNILLEFIYPVSFLDELCKTFYQGLCQMQVVMG